MSELADALHGAHQKSFAAAKPVKVTVEGKAIVIHPRELSINEATAINRETYDPVQGRSDPEQVFLSRLMRMSRKKDGSSVFDELERDYLADRCSREDLASIYVALTASIEEGKQSGKVLVEIMASG